MDSKSVEVILYTTCAMLLFIVFRSVNLWYWKIDENINNQKKIIDLLDKLNSNKKEL